MKELFILSVVGTVIISLLLIICPHKYLFQLLAATISVSLFLSVLAAVSYLLDEIFK